MKTTLSVFLATALTLFSASGYTHFQMLYTADSALEKGQATSWALIFSHPFSNGYPMNMGTPQAFYVVHDRGEDIPNKTTDLTEHLAPVNWTNSDEHSATAFIAELPKSITRSIGDYSFILTQEKSSPWFT